MFCLGGGEVAGAAIKEAGTLHWHSPNEANNSSGFTALGAGMRVGSDGTFVSFRLETYWWSSTQVSAVYAVENAVISVSSSMLPGTAPKTYGFSVRCVRN